MHGQKAKNAIRRCGSVTVPAGLVHRNNLSVSALLMTLFSLPSISV